MTAETAHAVRPETPAPPAPERAAAWRTAIIWSTIAVLGLLSLHLATLRSMMRIWTDNRSFAHCWFVAPLSLYMIWRNRGRLATVAPRVSLWGLAAVAGFGAVWFIGQIGAVQIIQQLSLVGMLLGAVWAILGGPAVRLIAYPLAFLFLTVPMGEELFPILISIAGKLAVLVLKATGTPVGYDGVYLRVPYGEWQITEACSGLNFLLSVLTVGAVFAYTNYTRAWKRAAFLAFCVVAAILTNGFRVWLLAIIGLYSYMKSPLVHKHLSLGWVLFAIMVTVIFWVGRRFSDPESVEEQPVPGAPPGSPRRSTASAFATASIVAIAIGAAWPFVAKAVDRPRAGAPPVVLAAPADRDGWTSVPFAPLDWHPHYVGAKATIEHAYEKTPDAVGLYIAYFRDQRQGAELARIENGLLTPGDHTWRYFLETRREVPGAGLTVGETPIESFAGKGLVWQWYWTGSRYTDDERQVKLDGMRSKLNGRGDDAAVLVLHAQYTDKPETAVQAMASFLRTMKPEIDREVMGPSRP